MEIPGVLIQRRHLILDFVCTMVFVKGSGQEQRAILYAHNGIVLFCGGFVLYERNETYTKQVTKNRMEDV